EAASPSRRTAVHRFDSQHMKVGTSMARSRPTILNLMLIVFLVAVFLSLERHPSGLSNWPYLVGFALLFPFLIGPILVKQSQWVTNDFEIVPIDPEGPEMRPDALADYHRAVDDLAPLGFVPVLSYASKKLTPNAFSFSTL